METNQIPALLEFLLDESAKIVGLTAADITNTMNKKPQYVAIRRLYVFTTCHVLGISKSIVQEKLKLKGTSALYGMLKIALATNEDSDDKDTLTYF